MLLRSHENYFHKDTHSARRVGIDGILMQSHAPAVMEVDVSDIRTDTEVIYYRSDE